MRTLERRDSGTQFSRFLQTIICTNSHTNHTQNTYFNIHIQKLHVGPVVEATVVSLLNKVEVDGIVLPKLVAFFKQIFV